MNTLSERLDAICLAKKIKLNGLADELGVSPTALYQIKNGRTNNPSMELIQKIKSIGVSVDWFLTGEGSMFLNKEVGSNTTTPILWKELKEQYEKRIKDLEFIAFLYKQEKGMSANFNFVSKMSRVNEKFKSLRIIKGSVNTVKSINF